MWRVATRNLCQLKVIEKAYVLVPDTIHISAELLTYQGPSLNAWSLNAVESQILPDTDGNWYGFWWHSDTDAG